MYFCHTFLLPEEIMIQKWLFLLTWLLFTGESLSQASETITTAEDIIFKVEAPTTVAAGSRFRVTYTINVSDSTEFLLPTELSETFDILFGPSLSTSTSFQLISGKQTKTVSTSYLLVVTAKEEGAFTIGPATIKTGDSEYQSDSFTITVLPPDQADRTQLQGTEDAITTDEINIESLFMRMIVSKNSVYEQEGFLVTYKIYTVLNVTGLNNVKFPNYDGFIAQDIALKDFQWETERYKERDYKTVTIKQTVLYPLYPGRIPIESAKIDAIIKLQTKSSRSIFNDFYGTYQDVSKELVTEPVTIDVKTLPSEKPASFTGAAGNFTITSSIDTKDLATNGFATLRLKVAGNGNLRYLTPPVLDFPEEIEIIRTNNILSEHTTSNGVTGSKTFEYQLKSRNTGTIITPSVEFSYFDVQTQSYQTLNTEPLSYVQTSPSTVTNVPAKSDTWKNLVFVVDVSGSMIAEDFKPNRMEAAKEAVISFINSNLNNSAFKYGIVSFAGDVRIDRLLTGNHTDLVNAMQSLNIGTMQDGTDIGDALMLGMAVLKTETATSNVLVLITDGINTLGEIAPETASQIAKLFDIRLYTIGLSSYDDAPYPVKTDTGVIYHNMKPEIDGVLLTKMAKNTGGMYFRADNNDRLLQIIEDVRQRESRAVENASSQMMSAGINTTTAKQLIIESFYNNPTTQFYDFVLESNGLFNSNRYIPDLTVKQGKQFRSVKELGNLYILIIAIVSGLILVPVLFFVFVLRDRKKGKKGNRASYAHDTSDDFDDFIRLFCRDKEFQLSRIKFPIGNRQRENWKHINQNYITPFENKAENAYGEWITRTESSARFIAGWDRKVIAYSVVFQKNEGKWYLTDYQEMV